MRILGNNCISTKRRVALGWTLVVSTLLYNVHIWSSFNGKPRNILNQMYMRLWRRVAGDPRFGRTTWSDVEVRRWLDVPSIDCYMRKKRLKYFSRLARADFDALHAALQSKSRNGDPVPWVSMITRDLCVLRLALPELLAGLPMPDEDMTPYWDIARQCPAEWAAIVAKYNSYEDDFAASAASTLSTSAPHLMHTCQLCKRQFPTDGKLAQHMSAKHGLKCEVRKHIGDISACPVCKTDFQSRNRLVMHLMKKTTKSLHRKVSCRVTFMRMDPPEINKNVLARLEKRDAATNRDARRRGHQREMVLQPCRRTAPAVHKGKCQRRCASSVAAFSGRSLKRRLHTTLAPGVQSDRPTKAQRLTQTDG